MCALDLRFRAHGLCGLRDPREMRADRARRIAAGKPAIVWIAGNVHGGETSGADASLKTLYELAAGLSCDVQKRNDNLITVIDAKTGKPIGAKIIYERLSDGKQVGVTNSNPETGEYETRLPGGQLYGFRAEAPGHLSESQNLDLKNMSKDATIEHKDITLAPIELAKVEPDATIVLNNIFFEFDKATLKSESFPELNRMVDLMKNKSAMTVEISGHADATGPEEYNMKLSESRAKAVSNYLIQKSIGKERISVTFFGETKPIETNDTKEGRSKNRRVEFKIIKM